MDDHAGCKRRKPLSLLGLRGKRRGWHSCEPPGELQLRERCPWKELGLQPEEHGLCQLQAIW